MYKLCLNEGAIIYIHDPYVKFWDELNLDVSNDISLFLNNLINILIISTNHDEYKNSNQFIDKLMNKENMMILDTVGLFSENEIKILSRKHSIKVLGRGDI